MLGGNVESLFVGGAALDRNFEIFLSNIGFPYCVGYGMTETASHICQNREREIGSVGKPDDVSVRIDSDKPCEEPGEILVKGRNVMLGYFKNEEATKQTFTSDGWLKTGDLGVFDDDGYLYIKGR